MVCEVDTPKSIDTKFGKATILNGYYRITSTKEGNHNKLLHRLLFEEFYQCDLDEEFPEGVVLHHEDGNKLNNEMWNLVPMTKSEHLTLHNEGNEYGLGYKRHIESKIKASKSSNSTGFFRVHKLKKRDCKQGFLWVYMYRVNSDRKRIFRTNLVDLKEKVISENLLWKVVDENKAIDTCEKYGYDFNNLKGVI